MINRNDFCRNCSTCDQVCGWLETVGYLDYAGAQTYYAKCYNNSASPPLNRVRIAFPSQSGTTEIDPALPKWNVFNKTTCWRMLCEKFICSKL